MTPPTWTPAWFVKMLYKLGLVTISPWPKAPEGATHRVLYTMKDNPSQGMVCYRMADGALIPLGLPAVLRKPWVPDERWEFNRESAV
jgi:hypothetical protein